MNTGTDTADPSTLAGAQRVAGEPSRQGTGPGFRAIDPTTGAEFDPVYVDATRDEIDRAVRAAADAFAAFDAAGRDGRAALLEAIAANIEGLGDTLIERCGRESGLPSGRLRGERGRTTGQLRMFAARIREGSYLDARIVTADAARKPIPRPDLRTMSVPIGPVAVFGASNFPLAFSVVGGDTASALAAGCPVVVKGHPAHPGTCELLGAAVDAAVRAAGLPGGCFSLLHGASNDVGAAIVQHPLIRAVGFTGSLRGGRALFDLASARPDPIPVYAEMGSTNPVYLLPAALAARGEALGKGLARSVTLGVGQFCTNPGLVFAVAGPALDAFVAALGGALPATAGPMLHPGIRAAYDRGVARLQGTEGVTVAAGADGGGEGPCDGIPRVFSVSAETFAATPHLREEVFGPATIVVACPDVPTMIRLADGIPGQLTATLHADADDLGTDDARALIARLRDRVGRLVFNGFPTGVEVCDSMHHGGPYPATTDARVTSVGSAAIQRFLRPVCLQDCPDAALPDELRDANPRGIWRLVDGTFTRDPIARPA